MKNKNSDKDNSIKKAPGKGASVVSHLAILGLFTAISLAIYGIESAIPNPIPIPGIKLGLANIVILVVLSRFGKRDACLVLTTRILLSALLFGQLVSLLYSFVGGFLCLFGEMGISTMLRKKHLYITGTTGALLHNLGQLLVAFLLTRVTGVFLYLPYLLIAGILTGLFTGLCSHFLLKLLDKAIPHMPGRE